MTPEQISALRARIAKLEAQLAAKKTNAVTNPLPITTPTVSSACPISLDEVADLIASPEAQVLTHGNYVNRRGVRGYYLQLKCAEHWCKLSASHADRAADRITAEELDGIDPVTLEPTVRIPRNAISAAFRSYAAEQASVNKYANGAGVEGIWAEFYYDGHWYMVSVSHLDVPARASRAELERIADELLRQQGRRYRRIGLIR